MATSMWREATDDPLPKMEPAEPEQQIQDFELRVVELVFREATAETAKRTADQTWDLVHDRPDDDPVKQRVVKGHEVLARLSAEGVPPADE
jgi:hypothetical protein